MNTIKTRYRLTSVRPWLRLNTVILLALLSSSISLMSAESLELGIRLSGPTQVLLTWTNSGVVLEEASSLGPTNGWHLSSLSPNYQNGFSAVDVTNSNASRFFRLRSVLPPDPSEVAPAVDPTVATSIDAATEFLYTGPTPIQTGVTNGTIEPRRVSVLRGLIRQRDNTPVSGVAISVLNHPELGQTLSRVDGAFDLVVNGGGQLTVSYHKDGFLTSQRAIVAPWRDYAWLPDIVLVPLDAAVNVVDLNVGSMQVARGNPVTDTDGNRRATLLVPSATTAQMMLPDGSQQTLTTIHIRATEYTVGASGPEAMPAQLPPSSGYTYASELSADEALAAGAINLSFSQPLPFYVENFLGFPVGKAVPTGYYDRQLGQWVASANGRVIKLLSITNGLANLDLDGNGLADSAAALTALGVTTEERAQLAQLYTPGQTLWRVPISHFTPWDCNWPYGPPQNAISPPGPNTPTPPVDDEDEGCGSTIGIQEQTLGETVPVIGAPWGLQYQSERTPGRKDAYTLQIPVSGPKIPPSLLEMRVEVTVCGRRFETEFSASTNLVYTFTWDGKDAYGRAVQGKQPAEITVSYDYQPQYYSTVTGFALSFARAEALGGTLTVGRGASRFSLSKTWIERIGPWDGRSLGLGGWALQVQHAYDPYSQTLYLGNGHQRRAGTLPAILSTVAGNGTLGFSGDGGLATAAKINGPSDVAVDADGAAFFVDSQNDRVRRVGTDGLISTVAGKGTFVFSGDGGPATAAGLAPRGIALAADGSLFISELNRVRRVGPDGIISTFAGTGTSGFSGDGGPASAASLSFLSGLAVGPDGSLFICDGGNSRVRRVGTDGVITTVAGNGTYGFSGDGGPAVAATLGIPQALAVSPAGDLYISDVSAEGVISHRIRRVRSDGIINTIAGNGPQGFSGDGGLAINANLSFPGAMAFGPDGSLFFTVTTHMRRVGPDGIITTVAGNGAQYGSTGLGEGTPATAFAFNPTGLALAPDGSLYTGDAVYNKVRRVRSPLPDFSTSDYLVPSEDGAEIYVFDSAGRHMKTLDALTGIARLQFSYNSNGCITSVADLSGNVTTIERSGDIPSVIVAPHGQRTALALNSDGWLIGITNPASEVYSMSYSPDGLLQSFQDPRLNLHQLAYDGLGRLTNDLNPASGGTILSRAEQTNGYTVATTSALGRPRVYQVEQLPSGATRRTVTEPEGVKIITLRNTDASQQVTNADGSVITVNYGPDPRWGMLAPIATKVTWQNPGGLTKNVTTTRSATLSDPANLLSLSNLLESLTINGRNFTNVYDAATRTVTSTSAAGRQRTTTLDALGRIVQSQVAGLLPSSFAYDASGRLASVTEGTGADARTTAFTYNTDGYLDTVIDPMGRTNSRVYDLAGRVTTQTLPDARTVAYSYDANGNLTSLIPPGRPAHLFAYSPVDLQAEYIAPDVGSGGHTTSYTYDPDQELTQVTRPDQQVIDYGYDDGGACTCGRLSSLTLPAAGVLRYSYDPTTGKLNGITNSDAETIAYTYTGSLISDTAWTGPVAGKVVRTYDGDFRVSSLSVNGTGPIAYQYDADSQIVGVGNFTLNRNPQNGQVSSSVLVNTTDGWQYDGSGRATNYSASNSGTELFRTQFAYDKLSRITTKNETIQGTTSTFEYGYDLAGRLAEVRKDGVLTSSYTFDSNGNRLTSPNLDILPVYDNQDRLLQYGTTTYSYTANGELSAKTNGVLVTIYDYDVLGNLKHVGLTDGTAIDYIVDGQNRRIGKKVNGVLVQGFLYQDGLKPIAELDGTNQIVSQFVYATRANVPEYMIKGGVTYRIITDHLGSPRLVVDVATGVVAQRLDYDEFGNIVEDTTPGFQPFGFAGGLFDRDTKLLRFGARDYDAQTGRWTAKDPLLFASADINLYPYAGNDPNNLIDPRGTSDDAIIPLTPSGLPIEGVLLNGGAILGAQVASGSLVVGTPVSTTVGSVALVTPVATLPLSSLAAAEGAGIIIGSGVVAAGAVGVGTGLLIDRGITAYLGKSLGEEIYDSLHPEENAPAYDPTKDRPRKCH